MAESNTSNEIPSSDATNNTETTITKDNVRLTATIPAAPPTMNAIEATRAYIVTLLSDIFLYVVPFFILLDVLVLITVITWKEPLRNLISNFKIKNISSYSYLFLL